SLRHRRGRDSCQPSTAATASKIRAGARISQELTPVMARPGIVEHQLDSSPRYARNQTLLALTGHGGNKGGHFGVLVRSDALNMGVLVEQLQQGLGLWPVTQQIDAEQFL